MPTNNETIKRFLKDTETANAVHSLLRSQFLKSPKERDVQYLAASWLAKELFEEGWKEMLKLGIDNKKEEKIAGNIGL